MANDKERINLFLEHIYIYKKDVFRIIYNVFEDKYISDELTQNVMLNAWKGLHTLKDFEKSKPWLKMITRNVIRSYMKRKSFNLSVEEIEQVNDLENHEELHSLEDDILEIVLKKENSEKLGNALNQLEPVYRMIVSKHVIGEVTFREISRSTGIKYVEVLGKYKKGIKMLKSEFLKLEGGGELNGRKKK